MCNNAKCEKRYKCTRYMSKPSHWQSCCNYEFPKDDCFWDVRDSSYVKRSIEEMKRLEGMRNE